MVKTLSRHGNSLALVIDRAILDLLRIGIDTPLEITTDGDSLTISPVRDPERRARLAAALEEGNERYGRMLKRLAE